MKQSLARIKQKHSQLATSEEDLQKEWIIFKRYNKSNRNNMHHGL